MRLFTDKNSTKRREKKKAHDTNAKKKLKKRKKKKRRGTDDCISRILLFAITTRARFLLKRTLTQREDL